MTTAHVEKFAELVGKDPALLAKLGLDKVNADAAAASASEAAFITNAVKEAKAHGLEFTEEELKSFMAAERTAAASGELSDTQLEAVAGGASYDEILESMLSINFQPFTTVIQWKRGNPPQQQESSNQRKPSGGGDNEVPPVT